MMFITIFAGQGGKRVGVHKVTLFGGRDSPHLSTPWLSHVSCGNAGASAHVSSEVRTCRRSEYMQSPMPPTYGWIH